MIVKEVKSQNLMVGDWMLVNDGNDRSFSAGQVVIRQVIPHKDKNLITYSLTLLFEGGKRLNETWYKNQTVSQLMSL